MMKLYDAQLRRQTVNGLFDLILQNNPRDPVVVPRDVIQKLADETEPLLRDLITELSIANEFRFRVSCFFKDMNNMIIER